MKKVISYKDLVLNTLLDAIKREGRYTIDNIDIMNYENFIRQVIKYNELDISIGELTDGRKFTKEMDEYTYVSSLRDNQIYTLLPWISKEELETDLENTIFSPQDMQIVSKATKDYFRFSRDNFEIYHLERESRTVVQKYAESISFNIKSLEAETANEKAKLQKIKSRMGR